MKHRTKPPSNRRKPRSGGALPKLLLFSARVLTRRLWQTVEIEIHL